MSRTIEEQVQDLVVYDKAVFNFLQQSTEKMALNPGSLTPEDYMTLGEGFCECASIMLENAKIVTRAELLKEGGKR